MTTILICRFPSPYLQVLMEFFDCNACFGYLMVPPPRIAKTAQDLIEEMDFCGITEALVYIGAQRDDSPVFGNELLIKETKGLNRLHRTWAILPPQTDELPPLNEFFASMKKNSVRALRAFPSEHRFLMTRTTFAPLYDLMMEKHIPLVMSIKDPSGGSTRARGWSLVQMILSENPSLILIVTDQGTWGQDRFFRPLIEEYKNLYLDTSRYEVADGIKAFCDKYGSDRLLFGTGFPEIKMGGSALALAQADISSKDKAAIASENLKGLLRRVRI